MAGNNVTNVAGSTQWIPWTCTADGSNRVNQYCEMQYSKLSESGYEYKLGDNTYLMEGNCKDYSVEMKEIKWEPRDYRILYFYKAMCEGRKITKSE